MGENSGHQNEKVMCDFCLEKPLPMVKSHLSCETSLCQAHLDKHSTKASLKDHVLVEPCDVDVFAKRRCPQHGKLLECYHVTDSVCICVLCCVTSSHQIHKIISVEEAFGQAQNDFPKTLQSVKKYEAAVNRSLENLIRRPVPEEAAVKLPKPPIVLDESTKEAILTLFQQFVLVMKLSLESSRDNTKITEKAATTAISTVRVELDCRRNTVSFYNIKTRVLAKRHQLIQTVNIPASYPVHASFSISSGSLRLL
ncbi:E3 ubiquitin-protein ligase Midline-1-like [Mergus octosetaceus]